MVHREHAEGVRIGIREIYDKIVTVDVKVSAMADYPKRFADHETRIRALERWRYGMGSAILLAVSSLIVAILNHGR